MHSRHRISGEEGNRTGHRPSTPSHRSPRHQQDRIVHTSILLVAINGQGHQVLLRLMLNLSGDKNEQRTAARPSTHSAATGETLVIYRDGLCWTIPTSR